ncbi:TMhelix containing protein [Vibrio phage 3.058.O._10N.286.46.B8]|nr:TMhelix containing protein [Vibrio phage 2.058.O._10N.286.46.B8]AUS03125.1 TMhelix containing protein [Vibrio phage 3.058.O._10N.286.46.B8]
MEPIIGGILGMLVGLCIVFWMYNVCKAIEDLRKTNPVDFRPEAQLSNMRKAYKHYWVECNSLCVDPTIQAYEDNKYYTPRTYVEHHGIIYLSIPVPGWAEANLGKVPPLNCI